ncbi:MAG: 2-amino-4-hydroxy-6-hydroxymethyldihydropteridine diphosphokinase [Gemella sp.]|nr:2-amino-4-hydroxy-6-hydroxymethyldihydropteridine diphosphokinase [Gemella sp.]
MIVLGLGTSIEPKEQYLKDALEEISKKYKILKKSSVYKTSAWGGVAKNEFLNMCIAIESCDNAYELLEECHKIEYKLDRVREKHWADRTIDIDIILFNDQVYNDDKLVVPHKYIKERNFVLKPLIEVAGDIELDSKKLSQWLENIKEEIEKVDIGV